MNNERFGREIIEQIWAAQGLGAVHSINKPSGGMVNDCSIVNDSHVIRFDLLDDWGGICRYAGEKWAYEALRPTDVPVPEVITLDSSKSLAPVDYLILTKIPGTMVGRAWPRLSDEQRRQMAYRAGQYLATMHGLTVDGFGYLFEIMAGNSKAKWSDFVTAFFEDYGGQGIGNGAITQDIYERMGIVITQFQPLFDTVTRGTFVMGDYHFNNILQENGVISGVVDFEWAIGGDPAWDFRVANQLERDCHGSRAAFYAGYQSRRALPPQHDERSTLYRMLLNLDWLTMSVDGGWHEDFEQTYPLVIADLEWLEGNLSG